MQVDWCPVLRHLFHWLNGVPASKETVHKILNAGGSVVVVPGGNLQFTLQMHKHSTLLFSVKSNLLSEVCLVKSCFHALAAGSELHLP